MAGGWGGEVGIRRVGARQHKHHQGAQASLTRPADQLVVGLRVGHVLLLDGLLHVLNDDLVGHALAIQVRGDVGKVARANHEVYVGTGGEDGADVGRDGGPVVLHACKRRQKDALNFASLILCHKSVYLRTAYVDKGCKRPITINLGW